MRNHSYLKKWTLLFVFCFTGLFSINAQVNIDPTLDFYKDVQSWEIRGVVQDVPPLRPYSLSVIKDILNQVYENGSEKDIETASSYEEQYFSKLWNVDIPMYTITVISDDSNDTTSELSEKWITYPTLLSGSVEPVPGTLSLGYRFGWTVRHTDEDNFLLAFQQSPHDGVYDRAVLGPLITYLDNNLGFALEKDNFIFQAGVNRTGYGSFLNSGIALSERAFHSGNFDFTFLGNGWNYTQYYSVIGASLNYNICPNYHYMDALQGYLYPDKYMTMHALEFKPVDFLSFSYYEAMVFGGRFDPIYFLPAPYMTLQGLNGYSDNLLMGVAFDWKLCDGLLWAGDLLVDDINFNEVVKFNFDTRIRLAAKTGLIYASENKFLNRLTFDITGVLPYMYAHGQYEQNEKGLKSFRSTTINYQNYTNNGFPIGSNCPPNSLQFALSADMKPVDRLNISLFGNFIMHGNVSEDLSASDAAAYLMAEKGAYSTDGSIYNHTQLIYPGSSYVQYTSISENWEWLTQDHLMLVLQAGFNGSYDLKRKAWGGISLLFGYSFEFIHNNGINTNIFPGQGSEITVSADGKYHYQGNEYANSDAMFDYFKNQVPVYKDTWAQRLHDSVKHTVSIGFRYTF